MPSFEHGVFTGGAGDAEIRPATSLLARFSAKYANDAERKIVGDVCSYLPDGFDPATVGSVPAVGTPRTGRKLTGSQIELVQQTRRADMRSPPLCILCNNAACWHEGVAGEPSVGGGSRRKSSVVSLSTTGGEDGKYGRVDPALLGVLRWCPDMPHFFAIHDRCMFMSPPLVSDHSHTWLERALNGFQPTALRNEFIRVKALKCSHCHRTGAAIGCHTGSCKDMYHLPCAIQARCAIDASKFSLFCPRHSNRLEEKMVDEVMETYKKAAKDMPSVRAESIRALLDCIREDESVLMRPLGEMKECEICNEFLDARPKWREVVFTLCCGVRYIHSECAQEHASLHGLAVRCSACKRSDQDGEERGGGDGGKSKRKKDSDDEHIESYHLVLGAQGVYVPEFMPVDSAPVSACVYSRSAGNEGKGKRCEYRKASEYEEGGMWAAMHCLRCGVCAHRKCGAEPWRDLVCSCDDEDKNCTCYVNDKWECSACRSPPGDNDVGGGGADEPMSRDVKEELLEEVEEQAAAARASRTVPQAPPVKRVVINKGAIRVEPKKPVVDKKAEKEREVVPARGLIKGLYVAPDGTRQIYVNGGWTTVNACNVDERMKDELLLCMNDWMQWMVHPSDAVPDRPASARPGSRPGSAAGGAKRARQPSGGGGGGQNKRGKQADDEVEVDVEF